MSKVKRRKEISLSSKNNKVVDHDELMDRIRKTLYYGPSLKCHKISRPMADYASEIFSDTHKGHSLNRLNFATVGKFNNVTPCPLLMAMIYLDRLQITDPNFTRKITPSELFLVSLMVSTKFYCGHDEEVYISEWAEYGNISTERMMEIELEFLTAMDWNLYVSNAEFFDKLQDIEKILAKRQGLSRGWLTYTELTQLLPSISLAREIFNYTSLMCISYTASVFAIVGAFFIASYVPGTALYNNKSMPIDKTDNTGGGSGGLAPPTESTNNCTLNPINTSSSQEPHDDSFLDELDPSIFQDDDNSTKMKFPNRPYHTEPQSRNNNEIILETNFLYGGKFGFATGINLYNNQNDDVIDEGDGDGIELGLEPPTNKQNYSNLLLMLYHQRKSRNRNRFHDFATVEQKEIMPFVWSTFL